MIGCMRWNPRFLLHLQFIGCSHPESLVPGCIREAAGNLHRLFNLALAARNIDFEMA